MKETVNALTQCLTLTITEHNLETHILFLNYEKSI